MERWLLISGYDGSYEVSSLGRVRSKTKVLKQQLIWNGYLTVMLCRNGVTKRLTVHRLVATAFISNERGCSDVNHKDGNKTNNSVENLEWVTRSENVRHAYNTGLAHSKGKPCRCVETGRVFESAICAEKWVGIKPNCGRIPAVCNHRRGAYTCGGYHWEWAN